VNKTPEMVRLMRCPCCGADSIEEVLRTDTVEVPSDGEPALVEVSNVPIERCRSCGEEFSGPRAAQVKHNAICRTLGLLTPEEIRQLRERMGLTQSQLSQLSGIGEATISRWERGRLLQNRAMDRYLRLLASDVRCPAFLRGVDRARDVQMTAPSPSYSDPMPQPANGDTEELRARFPSLGSELIQCRDQARRFSFVSPSFGGAALVP
jgi:putative zinc finger/helix-turn-helix YgiT family protein